LARFICLPVWSFPGS